MAVKPWPEITTMEEAVEYIDAETAEAEKYCPASVSAYQTALSLANSYVSTQEYGADQWTALEGFLTDARAVWHENGCTKSGGGASPPPATTPPKQAPYVPPPKTADILGGGSSSMLLIGIVAGVAAWFIWGKKGKSGRKTKSRGRRVPRRRRRRR